MGSDIAPAGLRLGWHQVHNDPAVVRSLRPAAPAARRCPGSSWAEAGSGEGVACRHPQAPHQLCLLFCPRVRHQHSEIQQHAALAKCRGMHKDGQNNNL